MAKFQKINGNIYDLEKLTFDDFKMIKNNASISEYETLTGKKVKIKEKEPVKEKQTKKTDSDKD